MVEKACRTCLKLLRLESVPYFQVEDADVQLSPDSNRFKILSVFPEMALNITKKSVICSSCHETIEMFYHFKAKCLRTESMIMRYIHTKPDLEIETIDLKDVALVNNMGYVTYTETNSSHFGINAEKTNSSHKKSKDCLEGVSSRNSKYVDSLKSNQKQEIEKNKQQLIEGSKSTVANINDGSVSNKQINGYIGDEVVIERVKKNCSSKKIEEISKGVTIEKVETNKNLDKNSPGICNKSTNINKDYSSSDLSQIDEVVVKQEPITEDEYNDDSLYTSSTEFDESITVVKHELINEDEQEMVIQPENIILQVTQKTKELNGEEKVVLSGNNINENGYNTHKLNESLGNQQINGFEVERKTISKKQIKETNDKNKLQNCVREKLNEDEFKNNVTDMQEDTCVFKNLGEKQSLENLINTNQRKSERPLAKYELRKRVFKKTIDNSLHSGEKMKIAELNSNGIHSNIGKGFDLDPNKVFTNNEKEEKLKRKSTEIESKVENFEASVITERQISTFDYSVIKSIPSKSNTLYEKSVKTLMNRDKNSISRTNLKFYEINKKELNSEVSFISIKKKRLEQQDETTDLSIIPISKKINQPINIEEEKKVATEMKSEITERNTGNDDTIERELNEKPKNMENSPGRKINNNKQAFSSDKACLEMNTVEEEMKFHKEENISGIHDEVEIKTESMEIDELKNNNLNDEQISREINEAVNPVSKYETDEGNTSEELSSEITFNESSMELNSSSQTNIEMHKTVGNSEMFIKTVRNEANTYDDKTSNPLDVSEVKADEFKVTSMELATVSNSDGGLKVDVEGDQLDDSGIQDFVSEDLPKDDEQSIKCSVCSKYFVTKSRLKTHMLCHTDERPYKCSFCPKGFNDKSTLKKHQKIHSGVKEYECEICQRQFYCKGNLNKHMSTHSGERPYKCTICNKDFSRNEHLKQHKLIHTGDKNFECDICSKKFARRDSLIIHMMVHTGVRNYICEYCDKRCIDSSTLKKHLRSHTGDKPYECDVCQRRFTQKTHLTIHRRKHTGERPYNCTLCEKSFYSSNYLKIHQRTHTKEQPYECDVCKKKFSTVSNLKMHSKIHTGIRDFECGICSKMFIHKHDLRKHMMVHTREKPFSCHVCGKAFAKRTRTRQHIINMHKEVDISLVVIEHNNTYMKPFVKVEEDCKNIEEQV